MSRAAESPSRRSGTGWATAVGGVATGAAMGGVVVAVGFWLRANAAQPSPAAGQAFAQAGSPARPAGRPADADPTPAKPKPKPEKPKPEPKKPEKKPAKADPDAEMEMKKPEPEKKPEPAKKPAEPVAPEAVTFASVAGIFQAKCNSCHGAGATRGGLDTTSYAAIMKGGDGGQEVKPGNPDGSYLFGQIDGDSMPPDGRTKLSAGEKARVRAWILAGAKP